MQTAKNKNLNSIRTLSILCDRYRPEAHVRDCAQRGGIDWNSIAALARENRVTAQAGRNIARSGAAGLIPEPYRSEFAQAPKQAAAMNMLLDAARREIASAASDRGVPFIVLKGMSMLGRIYDFDERRLSDIDLFIKAEDREAFGEIMSALGYSEEEAGRAGLPGGRAGEIKFHKTVASATVSVEAHWDAAPEAAISNAFPLPPDVLWADTRRACSICEPAGQLSLSPEGELLFAIHHLAARHSFARLMWFLDIHYLLMEYAGALDPELLLQRLADSGLRKAACFISRFIDTFFDTAAPAPFGGEPGRANPASGILDSLIIDSLCGGPVKRSGILPGLFADSPTPYFSGYLFPPRDFLASRYPGVPGPLLRAHRLAEMLGKLMGRD